MLFEVATSVQYCEPERPCTYVIGPKNHRRWEISLLPNEDPKYMTTEEGAWSVLKRWITPEDATLWRQASYRFHALVARDWRKGRVFIAGDAAHQQPPFLGQGMCQGVRDVVNLSWKLQAVLAGKGGEELLNSYSVERGRHVRSLTTRIKDIGNVICERDLALARARDVKLLNDAGGVVKTVARQEIIPPLETGVLYSPRHPSSGTLFPQPRVAYHGKSVLLDEITGYGWRIVTCRPLNEVPEASSMIAADLGTLVSFNHATPLPLERVADYPGLQLKETEGVMRNWFGRYICAAVVVRPDHYVYGAVDNFDDLPNLLKAAIASLQ